MKTMDIKNAFQIAQNRKRKSDVDAITSEAKVLKRTEDADIKIIVDDDKTAKPLQSNQTEIQVGILSEQNKDVGVENEHLKNVADTNSSSNESIIILSENECSSELGPSILNSSLNKSIESSENVIVPDVDNTKSTVESLAGPSSTKLLTQNVQRKIKRMSPEEAKRRTELRAEKEKLNEQKRQEALVKKQEEKDKKIKEKMMAKLEKQRKKEEEDREREKQKQEKKEQEEKEKQDRLKMKNLIQEAKAEVKKKKEEMKMKVLEDRLKAIEEKKKMEEEKMKVELEKEKKKAKTKQAFESFFLKSSTSSGSASSPQVQGKEQVFLPFQVSDDMILAPIIPMAAKKRFDKEQLDYNLSNQGCSTLYIEALKSNQHQCVQLRNKKKDVKSLIDSEVIEIRTESVQPELLDLKAKLLQFDENIRPPYWGTFRKKSKIVHARNPFARENVFDYDVDSDEEWDEGGPGESLNGTEDDESEDDYEVDNEFFVPHGYLSAEEEGEDENDKDFRKDPEAQQARLKLKEREFLSEHNKKTTQLKPVILGCFFMNLTSGSGHDILSKSLSAFEAEDVIPVMRLQVHSNHLQSAASSPNELNSPKTPSNLKRAVPEEALPYLLRLLHANTNGRQKVIKEFQHFWLKHCKESQNSQIDSDSKENKTLIINEDGVTPDIGSTPNITGIRHCKISKRQLDMSITSVAIWCKPPHPAMKKLCWWVKEEFLVKYGLTDLPVPNEWKYTLWKDTEEPLPDQVSPMVIPGVQ